MLNGMRRRVALAGAAALLALTAACSGGVSEAQSCNDTTKALEGFNQKINTLSPEDSAGWNQAIKDLSGKLDGIANKAGGDDLKRLLKEMSKALGQIDFNTKDVTKFQGWVAQYPQRLQKACGAVTSPSPKQ